MTSDQPLSTNHNGSSRHERGAGFHAAGGSNEGGTVDYMHISIFRGDNKRSGRKYHFRGKENEAAGLLVEQELL